MIDFNMLRTIALVLALPVCIASCAFTCLYITMHHSPPDFSVIDRGDVEYACLLMFGVAVSVAQIYQLLLYKIYGDKKNIYLYWFATSISVLVSICTFHAGIQQGAISATQNSDGYQALSDRRMVIRNALEGTVNAKNRLIELDRITKSKEHDAAIKDYEAQLSEIDKEIDGYDGKGKIVSSKSTYESIANDVIIFFDLSQEFFGERLVIIISYFMIVGFALIADLGGTSLFAFALIGNEPEYLWGDDIVVERRKPEQSDKVMIKRPEQSDSDSGDGDGDFVDAEWMEGDRRQQLIDAFNKLGKKGSPTGAAELAWGGKGGPRVKYARRILVEEGLWPPGSGSKLVGGNGDGEVVAA